MKQAARFHQSGLVEKAETVYRKVLSIAPDRPDTLHLLGVLEMQKGRHEEAESLIRKALLCKPENSVAYNNLGLVLDHLGKADEAISALEKSIALNPRNASAHYNLARRLAGKNIDLAIAHYREAIAIDPESLQVYGNLGVLLRSLGRFAEAEECYRSALRIKGDNPSINTNLANLLMDQGRLDQAIAIYREVLAIFPNQYEAALGVANALRRKGNDRESLKYTLTALRLDKNGPKAWLLLSALVKTMPQAMFAEMDIELLPDALRRREVDPQDFSRLVAWQLRMLLEKSNLLSGWGRGSDAEKAQRIEELADVPLLVPALEEVLLTDPVLERFLTAVRAQLLEMAGDAAGKLEPRLPLLVALAEQCFSNEYVYQVCEGELERLRQLKGKLWEAMGGNAPFVEVYLSAISCYEPLGKLSLNGVIEATNYPRLAGLLKRQWVEPLQEIKIKDSIPALTTLSPGISEFVRQQYEENPYPRWKRRNAPGDRLPIWMYLSRLFPLQGLMAPPTGKTEVLIAGCGTGSHVIQTARRIKANRILAIDLSLSSLAYAFRMASELGLDNVEFEQADILQLDEVDQSFDVIESSGVLHHLENPMSGWRILTNLLKPGGYMKIGLYSRRARQAINAAREITTKIELGNGVQAIRDFRQKIMTSDDPLLGSITSNRDFYSMSGCRDLLFHVQEHQYDPIQISACVRELGLEFLGFEHTNPGIMNRYHERFPDDPLGVNLSNWDSFENENPRAFLGMFQFWLRKPKAHC